MLFEPHQQAADTVFCLFVFLLGWRVVKNSNIVIYELEKNMDLLRNSIATERQYLSTGKG